MLDLVSLRSLCGLFRNEGLDMKLEEISVKQINGVSALKRESFTPLASLLLKTCLNIIRSVTRIIVCVPLVK